MGQLINRIRDRFDDDDERVDGRDLPVDRDEPGSDDQLLRGLLLLLAQHWCEQHADEQSASHG